MKMVGLGGETSNTLFETLEEWNAYLKAEDIDFEELPTKPRNRAKRNPVRRQGPSP